MRFNILKLTTLDCKDEFDSCETHISHCNDKDPQIQTYLKEKCKKTCGHCMSAIKGLLRFFMLKDCHWLPKIFNEPIVKMYNKYKIKPHF